MNPELVKFHLPTTDQFSVAVDIPIGAKGYRRPLLVNRDHAA
jgi:hypothetical protein